MTGSRGADMRNPNAPGKGVPKTVQPIRRMKDIRSILTLLKDKPRDHLLFTMGVNNGLRTGDLLKLKVKDIWEKKPGESITIIESKTKKQNILMINNAVHRSLKNYREKLNPGEEAYLFSSRKGSAPLSVPSVNRLIKGWTGAINLQGRYGAHSLRKTWGYIQRVKYGTPYEVICKRYKHSSPAITMLYLGIEDKEIDEILLHEIG